MKLLLNVLRLTSQALLFGLCLPGILGAHPASGIVADASGNLYFIDSRNALYEFDSHHARITLKKITDGHWLALDNAGRFARSSPKYFERVTQLGAIPTLIYAGGGAPIAVGSNGALYYGSGESNGDLMFPGALGLSRIWPDGRQSPVSEELKHILETWDDGVTGLSAGPDKAVYVATWTGVIRVAFNGTAEVIKHPIVVPGCDVDFADHRPNNKLPFLRGIVVLPDRTIFAAATSCHAVIKINPGGAVETVMKSERPWSPTGVAIHGNNLYVLEYTNANGPATEGWRPRIKMIDSQGHIITVVSLE